MKVLVLCLKAFEMMEVSPFIDVFGWARDDFACDIEIVTCGYQQDVTSTFGISMKVDILIDDVKLDEYAALAIPGGFSEYGFYDEAYHEKTLQLIRAFDQVQKPIASVCVAAFPLAKSGVLTGKKATTYHLRGGYKREELTKSYGVELGNEWLVVDGTIITSSCPKTGPDVAFQLLKMLTSEDKMQQVQEAMGY